MGSPLGSIYSAIDSQKRRLIDALRNPRLAAEQAVGRANDDARALNEMTAAAAKEGLKYGPASEALAMKMADAYNPAGIFIGAGSKTWSKSAADQAKKMAQKGADPRQIWKETGTFRGPDGAWRQEIDDSAASIQGQKQEVLDWLSPPGPAEHPVGSIEGLIAHERLFGSYPDLRNIQVSLRKSGGNASYSPFDGFSERITAPTLIKEGNLADPKMTKSATLHELQHAIQGREKWAEGGSPDDAALLPFVRKIYANAIDNFQGESHELVKMAKDRAYRNLAGEAEARATQARMDMSEAQRRQVFPLDSYDVPVDQLIVNALRKRK